MRELYMARDLATQLRLLNSQIRNIGLGMQFLGNTIPNFGCGGFGMHPSTFDLCSFRTPFDMSSSWNIFMNQAGAHLSVSNGWNSPLLGFGAGMSYGDVFQSSSGPDLGILLGNAGYQASMYMSNGGSFAGAVGNVFYNAPGIIQGVVGATPGAGNTDLTPAETTAKRHYENLKNLLDSFVKLAETLPSDDDTITTAIAAADAKTTWAEKLSALNSILTTYKDTIKSFLQSGKITAYGIDIGILNVKQDETMASAITDLKDMIKETKDSSGQDRDVNIREGLIDALKSFDILALLSNYNTQNQADNLFKLPSNCNDIIEPFAGKLVSKAENIKSSYSYLLSSESLNNLTEAINDLSSSSSASNLKELYVQVRLILAMVEDEKFVANYGTTFGNSPLTDMVLADLRTELGDDDLVNPIRLQASASVASSEEVASGEVVEPGEGDQGTSTRDYSSKNAQLARNLLLSSYYERIDTDNDDKVIHIKYEKGSITNYYVIRNNQIFKALDSNYNVADNASAIRESNMPHNPEAMYEFENITSITGFENYNNEHSYKPLCTWWPCGWNRAFDNHEKISDKLDVTGLTKAGYPEFIIEEAKKRFDALYDEIQSLIKDNGPREDRGSSVYTLVSDSSKEIKHSMFAGSDNDYFSDQQTKKRANLQKEAYCANSDDDVIISGIITYTDFNGDQFTFGGDAHRQYYSEYVVLHNFIDIVKKVAEDYRNGTWTPS